MTLAATSPLLLLRRTAQAKTSTEEFPTAWETGEFKFVGGGDVSLEELPGGTIRIHAEQPCGDLEEADAFAKRAEAMSEEYGPAINEFLAEVAKEFEEDGFSCGPPFEMVTDDDFRWALSIYPKGSEDDRRFVDVVIGMSFASQFEEEDEVTGGGDGVAFYLELINDEGYRGGGIYPNSHTDHWWAPADDAEAVLQKYRKLVPVPGYHRDNVITQIIYDVDMHFMHQAHRLGLMEKLASGEYAAGRDAVLDTKDSMRKMLRPS
jgi:hypothetical protein